MTDRAKDQYHRKRHQRKQADTTRIGILGRPSEASDRADFQFRCARACLQKSLDLRPAEAWHYESRVARCSIK